MRITDLIRLAILTYKTHGLLYTLRSGYNFYLGPILLTPLFVYYKRIKKYNNDFFIFQGKKYFYYYQLFTWNNERSIEIPIVMDFVRMYEGKRILEVGNVLSRYFKFKHDILDKYEPGTHVIHEDIVDFKPMDKYDIIISISTIEHIGWDMLETRDDSKIPCAIENMKGLLRSPHGLMVITFPLGYNSILDRLLEDGAVQFTNRYYLKRISKYNKWKQTAWEDVKDSQYDKPHMRGNALVVALFEST